MYPDEFRDALVYRYRFTPNNMPNSCDGCSCGEALSVVHKIAKKRGFVTAKHYEIRNLKCVIFSLAGITQIIYEP